MNNLSQQIKVVHEKQIIKKKEENHIKYVPEKQKQEIKKRGFIPPQNEKHEDPMIEDLIVRNISINFKDIVGL